MLGTLVRRLTAIPAVGGLPERAVLDWTFGAYLGWVAVATCANVTAALVVLAVALRRRSARPTGSAVTGPNPLRPAPR
ncbi:hypothetical protein [Intrasporangium flavum]|uniref:hypothetical protein n=1 Tax=Intrasporangium flavum TaxID=1428657 RepID=UPI00096F5883|nr:hypothetical protein [Intrasporangium flavum]